MVPVEMRIRDLVQNGGALLTAMRESVSCHDIDFKECVFPITIIRSYSYLFRDALVHMAGKKLLSLLQDIQNDDVPHIIHCRSYFAAATALQAKQIFRHLQVSFDMRSLLPPEVPMMFPVLGTYLYGRLKEWESELLRMVDCSFLPCKRGIRLLELEGVTRLPYYVPIAGFAEVSRVLPVQSDELGQAVIGYVGGLGAWHSATMLKKVFAKLAALLPDCLFETLTSDPFVCDHPPVKVYSLPHTEMKDSVKRLWAMVIPGHETADSYFTDSKMSANFFSTKAAEALSVGVPLIVNAKIQELAEFVRLNRCGLVFSIKDEILSFEQVDEVQLGDSKFWAELRKSAYLCGQEFSAQAVYRRYLDAWNQLDLTRGDSR